MPWKKLSPDDVRFIRAQYRKAREVLCLGPDERINWDDCELEDVEVMRPGEMAKRFGVAGFAIWAVAVGKHYQGVEDEHE